MKIVRATVRRVRVPLDKPVSFSIKTLHHRENLIVELEDENGTIGTGFCLQDNSAAAAQAALVDDLLPFVVGQDADKIRAIADRMYRLSVRAGRRGSLVHAISAVDIALWDRLARAASLPLHTILGGYRDEVPCYASGGYYHEGESLNRLEEEVQAYVDAGFDAVKIKVGRLSLRQEVERVELVRKVIGSDRELMVDANQAFTTVEEAAALCRRIEHLDIGWFEEPFAVDAIESFIRLKQKTAIPLATGEVEATRWAFKELVHRQAIDIIQADATVCGGVTEWLSIAGFAASWGVSLAPHYHWDLHVQLGAAFPQVVRLEKFVGVEVKNFDLLLEEPMATTRRSTLAVPDGPGHDIRFSEEALKKYTVDVSTVWASA